MTRRYGRCPRKNRLPDPTIHLACPRRSFQLLPDKSIVNSRVWAQLNQNNGLRSGRRKEPFSVTTDRVTAQLSSRQDLIDQQHGAGGEDAIGLNPSDSCSCIQNKKI